MNPHSMMTVLTAKLKLQETCTHFVTNMGQRNKKEPLRETSPWPLTQPYQSGSRTLHVASHFVFVFLTIQFLQIERCCYLTHSHDYLVINEEQNPMQCIGVENLRQSTKLLRQWFKRQEWRPQLSFLRLAILASTGNNGKHIEHIYHNPWFKAHW